MLKALGYRLLVKPDEIETKTETGIVLAVDEKLEKGARITGTVVDIGPECWGMHKGNTAWCSVGDKVFWAKYAGKHVIDPYTNEEFVVLNDEDVVVAAYQNGTYSDNMETLAS